MHRHSLIATLVAAWVVSTAIPAAALTPVKVQGGAGNQMAPSATGVYVAWANHAKGESNVYVRKLSSARKRRVNPRKTEAWMGSFVGQTTKLVYQQWSDRRLSDIYFYDIATRTRTRVPNAINKRDSWEADPVASEHYIAFDRTTFSRTGRVRSHRLLVYDRKTGTIGELYSNLRPAISFSATFAGTVYVAWEVCGKTMCKSYYWSEAEGTKRVLVPTEKAAYNPTIDETAGSVYFVRAPANGKCGTNITIGREALGSSAYTMLTTLPRGVDAGDRMSLAPNSTTGFQDLYFDRWNCRTSDADIYALRSVDA